MESESLSSEIAQRKDLLEKIEAEDRVVTKVRRRERERENREYGMGHVSNC